MHANPTLPMLMAMLLVTAFPAAALEPRTAHTFELSDGETAPDVELSEIAWLAGSWTGSAFGSDFEEHWSSPAAGSMVGYFKLMNDGQVSLYELMTITSDDGRLSLKVRHFNADFTAWEDKAEFVNFELVGIEENAVHFSGLSFYRETPDRLTAYLVIETSDDIREETLVYRRK